MRRQNLRKIQVVYWSFKEFQAHHLSACKRTRWEAKRIHEGHDHALSRTVQPQRRNRFDLSGYNIVHFFAKPAVLLGDMHALKEALSFKGASGALPCPLCSNLVDHKSMLADHDSNQYCVPSANLDPDKVRPHNDASVLGMLRKLQTERRRLTAEKFKRLQRQAGWNLDLSGILCSPLRDCCDISSLMYDWMHVYMVSGIFNCELGLLVQKLRECRLTQEHIHQQLQSFHWPKRIGNRAVTGKDIFRKKQETDIKCQAREGLSVYGVLRCLMREWLKAGWLDAMQPHASSFFQLCKGLDCLQGIKQGRTSAMTVQTAILDHLQKHQTAYGTQRWVPKFHSSTHLPRMYQQHQLLCSCWCHERKHRELKRYASENLIGWFRGFNHQRGFGEPIAAADRTTSGAMV